MRRLEWAATIVLLLVIVWIINAVYVPAFRNPSKSKIFGVIWNYADGSVPIWNYQNASPPGVKEIIWDSSNPSYEVCTTFRGPVYRPEGDNDYNPAPEHLDWNPIPECWACHSNRYWVYHTYTAIAHGSGNPVGRGGR